MESLQIKGFKAHILCGGEVLPIRLNTTSTTSSIAAWRVVRTEHVRSECRQIVSVMLMGYFVDPFSGDLTHYSSLRSFCVTYVGAIWHVWRKVLPERQSSKESAFARIVWSDEKVDGRQSGQALLNHIEHSGFISSVSLERKS
jgi:hypothetical protein